MYVLEYAKSHDNKNLDCKRCTCYNDFFSVGIFDSCEEIDKFLLKIGSQVIKNKWMNSGSPVWTQIEPKNRNIFWRIREHKINEVDDYYEHICKSNLDKEIE